MKQFLRNNINYFIYFIFAIFVELIGVFIMCNKFYIRKPWIGLSILGIIFAIYNFIGSKKAKNITLSIFLTLQCLLCIVFVALLDNTGTLFDFNMLTLIKANNNFVVTIDINYLFIAYQLLILATFISLIILLSKYQDDHYKCKGSILTSSICLAVFLISHISVIIVTNSISEKKFMNSLYKDTNDKYVNYGSSSNAINELYKMAFFNTYDDLSNKEISEYIYDEVSTPTSKFGISKDNNLITIVVESLEWFSFISDSNLYPNGANLSDEQLDALFPNLREFYNMSVVMNNHYSENKTDMSEDEALLGVYPNSNYINFAFPNNSYPTSIANTLKYLDSNINNNLFHNNDITFYNRDDFMPSMGYDNLYSIDDMVENGATNYMSDASLKGMAMNLDSEMIKSMKDLMFVTNKRFNTHITTVTMHGNYVYRENIKQWYDKMDSVGVDIDNDYLKNYLAYTMDFDCALGIILDDLKEKNLLDNTTIVIMSDHNAYMNHLTNYVKDIYDYSDDNYTELFRVPLMIYDPNIEHQIINKFTTTYDITPTILDMFGINYYSNLYYGNSIFSEEESVLYSKAFDVFITDDLYFSNINNILYKKKNVDDQYINEVEEKCIALLKKIFYTNHIFDNNYFGKEQNYQNYITNFNLIN